MSYIYTNNYQSDHIDYQDKYLYKREQISQQIAQSQQKSHTLSDENFQPQFYAIKRMKMPLKKKINKGPWTLEENKIYYNFLINNKESFINQAVRRQSRVFCKLSQILQKKRTPDQCRSHHQKISGRYEQPLATIIYKVRQKIKTCERQLLYKQKIRIFGKLKINKLQERQIIKQQEKIQDYKMKEQDQCQINKIVEGQFYRIITYKGSNVIKLNIEEMAISSYDQYY